jgi:hypothetical protein
MVCVPILLPIRYLRLNPKNKKCQENYWEGSWEYQAKIFSAMLVEKEAFFRRKKPDLSIRRMKDRAFK